MPNERAKTLYFFFHEETLNIFFMCICVCACMSFHVCLPTSVSLYLCIGMYVHDLPKRKSTDNAEDHDSCH